MDLPLIPSTSTPSAAHGRLGHVTRARHNRQRAAFRSRPILALYPHGQGYGQPSTYRRLHRYVWLAAAVVDMHPPSTSRRRLPSFFLPCSPLSAVSSKSISHDCCTYSRALVASSICSLLDCFERSLVVGDDSTCDCSAVHCVVGVPGAVGGRCVPCLLSDEHHLRPEACQQHGLAAGQPDRVQWHSTASQPQPARAQDGRCGHVTRLRHDQHRATQTDVPGQAALHSPLRLL